MSKVMGQGHTVQVMVISDAAVTRRRFPSIPSVQGETVIFNTKEVGPHYNIIMALRSLCMTWI